MSKAGPGPPVVSPPKRPETAKKPAEIPFRLSISDGFPNRWRTRRRRRVTPTPPRDLTPPSPGHVIPCAGAISRRHPFSVRSRSPVGRTFVAPSRNTTLRFQSLLLFVRHHIRIYHIIIDFSLKSRVPRTVADVPFAQLQYRPWTKNGLLNARGVSRKILVFLFLVCLFRVELYARVYYCPAANCSVCIRYDKFVF